MISQGGYMPIHDWTRAPAGLFHHFHQDWSVELVRELNRSRLPAGYYALVEQRIEGPEPDVIAVETPGLVTRKAVTSTALLDPPKTRLTTRIPTDAQTYARKANRISIHHPLGHVVALIEIVSPGNKDSRHAIRSFVDKAATFISSGVHLLVVDLFPPTDRDPHGIHEVILNQFTDQPFVPPAQKPLTLVSYQVANDIVAHVEPVAVGDAMPDMPLFLSPDAYILVPLETTYSSTWGMCPAPIRELIQPGTT
jgi:hypothetical protein